MRSFFDSLFFFFSDLCYDNAIREESFCSPSFFCSHYEWLVFVLSCFCFLPSFVLLFFATKFFSYSFMHQSTYSSTRTKRFYFVSARKKPLPLAPLFFYRTFSSVSLRAPLSLACNFAKIIINAADCFVRCVAPWCIHSTDYVHKLTWLNFSLGLG